MYFFQSFIYVRNMYCFCLVKMDTCIVFTFYHLPKLPNYFKKWEKYRFVIFIQETSAPHLSAPLVSNG